MEIQPAALELLTALAPVALIEVGDLLIAKVLAGRPKDIDDARALWKLHGGSVDKDRVRHTLRLLEEALAQGDLVATFDGLGS